MERGVKKVNIMVCIKVRKSWMCEAFCLCFSLAEANTSRRYSSQSVSTQFLNSATNSKAQPKEETSLVNDNQYDEVWTTWCKQKMTFLIFFFGFWFFLLYLTMIHRFFFCCVDFFKIFCTLLVFKTRSIYKRNIQKRESPEVVTCL